MRIRRKSESIISKDRDVGTGMGDCSTGNLSLLGMVKKPLVSINGGL